MRSLVEVLCRPMVLIGVKNFPSLASCLLSLTLLLSATFICLGVLIPSSLRSQIQSLSRFHHRHSRWSRMGNRLLQFQKQIFRILNMETTRA